MKLCFLFGSVVLLIAGITLVSNSWEINAQSEVGLKRYQNATLAISFQYPSNWTKEEHPLCAIAGCLNFFTTVPKLNTTSNATVKTTLNQMSGECGGNKSKPSFNDSITAGEKCDVYSINVWVFDLNNPSPSFFEKPCNCNTLKDFVAWDYKRSYGDTGYTNHTFINDNKTTVGSNHSAWQMESINEWLNDVSKEKKLTVWAINGRSGYVLEYSFPADSRFDRYLDVFKNMLKSVIFLAPAQEKKPSFLNSSGVSNTSTSGNSIPFQNESHSLTILSHNSYTDSVGYFHVVGEVENNTPRTAEFVQVTGTFYDTSNDVVGTQFTYTSPSDIPSGEKAPFEIILTSASVPVSEIDHYRLVTSSQ